MLMQWGQFVDHDITHTPTVRGEDETGIQCCSDDGETLDKRDRHRACFPIDIPDNDRMFSKVTDFHLKQCISRFFFPVWPEMYGVCEVYASTQVPGQNPFSTIKFIIGRVVTLVLESRSIRSLLGSTAPMCMAGRIINTLPGDSKDA